MLGKTIPADEVADSCRDRLASLPRRILLVGIR